MRQHGWIGGWVGGWVGTQVGTVSALYLQGGTGFLYTVYPPTVNRSGNVQRKSGVVRRSSMVRDIAGRRMLSTVLPFPRTMSDVAPPWDPPPSAVRVWFHPVLMFVPRGVFIPPLLGLALVGDDAVKRASHL